MSWRCAKRAAFALCLWWEGGGRTSLRRAIATIPRRLPLAAPVLTLALLSACREETPIDPETTWQLHSLNGATVPDAGRATLIIAEEGRLHGVAPCNNYGGSWTGVGQDFRIYGVFSTRKGCPDLPAETAFFAALNRVTTVDPGKDRLGLEGPGIRLGFARLATGE
ncbi:META domain-containing protein [Pseudooceanicola algae]|uniref:META domain-containing protein n=1 Tax=Pseudooceanicola algae TaxID=1537215 RepID=UPI0018CBA2F0|nr:META domain-containing protein [Pseudooceanicola algae]